MSSFLSFEHFDDDVAMENYIREYDKTVMPVPDTEFEPYILLNKVRKHYMEYVIKLLSVNYERNVRIPNKRLYRLPSAIWRCAKGIEMSAAQTSMVLQIYRRNILSVIEELKNDTEAGIMNKKLYDCLYKRPENEKRTQTTLINTSDCNCQCTCNQRKKIRKSSESPGNYSRIGNETSGIKNIDNNECYTTQNLEIPVEQKLESQIELDMSNKSSTFPAKSLEGISESQNPDELFRQLEKLFEGDGNDDDIFESVLCDDIQDESSVSFNNGMQVVEKQDSVIEAHSEQTKSLDERLVSLGGLIINNTDKNIPEKPDTPPLRPKKIITSKWLCEEYFWKMKLLEMLDQLRDSNRSRLKQIKLLFVDLFGDESDDEDLLSPLNETPEFILSCKERIAPWVVKMLTPYYIKGRIKGKALFKTLAKHLIRLIYQCSQFPEQYEVHSFVSDFLKTHKVIRCEADFKGFTIMNI